MNIATGDSTISSQQGAHAQGDIVGRDKIFVETKKGMIERLLLRLKEQYDCNEQTQTIIDELARYHTRRAPDGVAGLQAKLEASGRSQYYDDAIEKKEMFAKLLQRWSLYSSAQMIFVHISHALHRPERAHGRHYEHTLPNQGPICPRRPGWVEGSHGTSGAQI